LRGFNHQFLLNIHYLSRKEKDRDHHSSSLLLSYLIAFRNIIVYMRLNCNSNHDLLVTCPTLKHNSCSFRLKSRVAIVCHFLPIGNTPNDEIDSSSNETAQSSRIVSFLIIPGNLILWAFHKLNQGQPWLLILCAYNIYQFSWRIEFSFKFLTLCLWEAWQTLFGRISPTVGA
jgi:hypothetical protein